MIVMCRARRSLGAQGCRFEGEGSFAGEVSPVGQWASQESRTHRRVLISQTALTRRKHDWRIPGRVRIS
jgi:hypothetical protein